VVFGPGFATAVIVLVLGMWARFARIARAETMALKTREFV
jgi:ABC-type dipeptide/oligopeptide/nickel transport system permease subunit